MPTLFRYKIPISEEGLLMASSLCPGKGRDGIGHGWAPLVRLSVRGRKGCVSHSSGSQNIRGLNILGGDNYIFSLRSSNHPGFIVKSEANRQIQETDLQGVGRGICIDKASVYIVLISMKISFSGH